MVALLILFGVLGGAGALMTVTLMRRGTRRTETAEGLLVEQEALRRAAHDRVSFGAAAVHNSVPTASDTYSRREGRP
ncbi:hypothetical protein [Streptomyces sp. SS]|uniref:hypothetical protein n=1 Tax=Streptomyces sp. SS TaxID=260742 RepID=UPI0002F270AB|nr:hypothetical protein [Streptomyces sp. SS]